MHTHTPLSAHTQQKRCDEKKAAPNVSFGGNMATLYTSQSMRVQTPQNLVQVQASILKHVGRFLLSDRIEDKVWLCAA